MLLSTVAKRDFNSHVKIIESFFFYFIPKSYLQFSTDSALVPNLSFCIFCYFSLWQIKLSRVQFNSAWMFCFSVAAKTFVDQHLFADNEYEEIRRAAV